MLKKHYKAILFDMDGTLLPMDMEAFTKGYFAKLYKRMAQFNISIEDFTAAIWKGTYAMMKNDGSRVNREVFWDTFVKLTGLDESKVDPLCLDFYENEFNEAVAFTSPNPALARETVKLAHDKAEYVILSTNPIFPRVGQKTRLSWLGMDFDDFDLVTAYEDEKYCKPNPQYFLSILERYNLKPEECLVIGNDEKEDCNCAKLASIDCYLVTDTMISSADYPWNGPKGTFMDLIDVLRNLE